MELQRPDHDVSLDAVTLSRLRHDLRDPLGADLGFARLLTERFEKQNEEISHRDLDSLRHIESAAQQMLAILGGQKPSTTSAIAEEAPPVTPEACIGTLLSIDDDYEWRSMLATYFGTRGYRVLQAANGTDGERVLNEEKVDVVLLDMSLPDATGLDLLERFRTRWQPTELPVVFVTGQANERTLIAALERGANDYVTKGLTDVSVIHARVRNQVSLKRAGDRVQELNSELQAAHAKISQLADSSGEALQNIPRWAASVAKDLTDEVRAHEIAVWTLENGVAVPLTETSTRPPSVAELEQAQKDRRFLINADVTVVSVAGMTSRVCGGLMVWGKRGPWSDAERQLLAAFAFQLGGALDLKQVQSELAVARENEAKMKKALASEKIPVLRLCQECERCYDDTVRDCIVDGTRLVTKPFPYVVAGKFRLVRLLGRGGMGEVYQAHDEKLKRYVAVKVIRPEHAGDSIRKRFEREATILAAVESPHVVRIYDAGGLPGGSAYFVTEILRGTDVRRLIESYGPGHPQQIARLVRGASLGLAAVHAREIIHRDVKPANIFLLENGAGEFQAKVIDFGIAKTLTDQTSTISLLIGTPVYMSPEQLGAQPLSVKTDVYSLAAVVWEALSGTRVVAANDVWRIMYEVMSAPARHISSLMPEIPDALDQAIARALHVEATQRPPVDEWGAEVAELLDSLPPTVLGWPTPLPSMNIEQDENRTVGEATAAYKTDVRGTTQVDDAVTQPRTIAPSERSS